MLSASIRKAMLVMPDQRGSRPRSARSRRFAPSLFYHLVSGALLGSGCAGPSGSPPAGFSARPLPRPSSAASSPPPPRDTLQSLPPADDVLAAMRLVNDH